MLARAAPYGPCVLHNTLGNTVKLRGLPPTITRKLWITGRARERDTTVRTSK